MSAPRHGIIKNRKAKQTDRLRPGGRQGTADDLRTPEEKKEVNAMTITKTVRDNTLTVALEGRLDTVTTPELDAELKNSLDGVETLIFDLEKLKYMSSAGLRVLLLTQKRMMKQGQMKIIHVGETIMEIFEVTGFSGFLTIE